MSAVGFCGNWIIVTCDKKLFAVHTKEARFDFKSLSLVPTCSGCSVLEMLAALHVRSNTLEHGRMVSLLLGLSKIGGHT